MTSQGARDLEIGSFLFAVELGPLAQASVASWRAAGLHFQAVGSLRMHGDSDRIGWFTEWEDRAFASDRPGLSGAQVAGLGPRS